MATDVLTMRMHPLQLSLKMLKVWGHCSMFSLYYLSAACDAVLQPVEPWSAAHHLW